jgi:signal transduction histidine kinase
MRGQVHTIATAIDQRLDLGEPVTRAFLRPMVSHGMAVQFSTTTGAFVDVRKPGFSGPMKPSANDDDLWATAFTTTGVVTISEDPSVISAAIESDPWPLVSFAVLIVLGVIGGALVIGRSMARPFRQLADAAAALGRGRFQLDLPKTRIPEAQAIAGSLQASAEHIRQRLLREREFGLRASHALRTPLTALRLELDELARQPDLPGETREVVTRSLDRIDHLDAATGELLALARQGGLAAGTEVRLADLVAEGSRRWGDELAAHGRTLTSAAEGDLDLTYTPGPVEQILELMLADVVSRTRGSVNVVYYVAGDGALNIRATAAEATSGRVGTAPVARARAVALALGGRLEGDWAEGGLDVWLPRR